MPNRRESVPELESGSGQTVRNETRRRLRVWYVMIGIGMVAGPPVNYFTYDRSLDALLRGLMDGAIIAALVGGYAQFVRDQWFRPLFRRLNFSANVIVNAFMYLALFHFGRAIAIVFRDPTEIAENYKTFLVEPEMLAIIPVFFLIAVAVEFLVQMNRLVGHNVLRYFLAGTYHRPKQEDRIFLFLDLRESTTMAEQMGGEKYYALLEQFVNALTEPVLATGGEIHEYVGDEVVITWKQKKGLRDANCVRCFFLIQDALNEKGESFERQFGRRPRFCAGLHGGQVIAGELGDIKRGIVFVGDIVNTAARLEEFAKKEARPFVVSEAIIGNIDMPKDLTAVYVGDHVPRGKEASVKLYEVRRVDGAQGQRSAI